MRRLLKIGIPITLILIAAYCLSIIGRKHVIRNNRYAESNNTEGIIKTKINKLSSENVDSNNGELKSASLLITYYTNNNYQPIWSNKKKLLPIADTLRILIKNADKDGLNPKDYHSSLIESLIKDSLMKHGLKNDTILARIDLLLTDAFFTYSAQQYAGSTHYGNNNNQQAAHLKEISLTDSLNKAIARKDIGNILSNFICKKNGYINLKVQLQKYLARNNSSDTNKGLNDTIKKIAMNMERWRWLPHNIPQPYIIVNVAGFNLSLLDSNKTVLDMKIIVGKTNKQTPLFNTSIKSITLNPWWEIPNSIATREMLPAIKKDKNYLAKNNIKVYSSWSSNATELNIDEIKWESTTPANFTYHLRQTPGASNALGRIAFMMPNNFSVYLHDTPQKSLFSRSVRAFSHGCIRIEKPLELATYLLHNSKYWTKDTIIRAINHDSRASIPLPQPVNVYICYMTAWADKNGQLFLAPDIYKYDSALDKALNFKRQNL